MSVTANLTTNVETITATIVVEDETIIVQVSAAARGPAGEAGAAGPNAVTSATTSDGTAALYLDSIRFEATNGGPTQLGEMAWESNDGSIDAMLESGVIVAMGEDLVIRVRNTTASPITKGTALAYDGTSGASGRIEVKPWVGSNIPTAKLFLGFAACDMPANSNGYSQWFGKLTEIDTSGGGQTWLDEQIIYAVPGASATLTNVAPTSGEYAAAAVVINAGSGTSGILFVRPTFEVASSTSATANTLVLRDANGGASLSTVTLSGTGGSPFTSTLTGGVNFANRTFTLPDVSGTLTTVESLANSATITASTAVAVDTIVLRDGTGQINITNSNVAGTTAYADTAGWTYAGSAASAHRTALGLGTGDSPTFVAASFTGVPGGANLDFQQGVNFRFGTTNRLRIRSTTVEVTANTSSTSTTTGAFTVIGGSGIGGNLFVGGTLSVTGASTFGDLIEQRNGNAAQESRIYGTYTDGSNYRRLALKMSSAGVAQIVAEGGGTGAAGNRIEIDGLRIGKGGGDIASNTALGASALNANTTGGNNTAVGSAALEDNTTGGGNSAVGRTALSNNTTGGNNSAVGTQALANNTTGSSNTAIGLQALISNTTGGSNAAVGNSSLAGNTTGSSNAAIGSLSGRHIQDGTTSNAVASNSVFIGAATKALASNQTNQIVIGYNATGLGSNTAVLGNDSIVTTALKGNVGIGTTSPTAMLDVDSDTVRVRTARTPASADAAGNAGDICWDADYIYVCTAANTWKRTAISTWP